MCGIAGWAYKADRSKEVFSSMLDALKERGPDDSGTWSDEKITLGHTRLSIIDPESSKQPMSDGEFTITFNGEIYNYQELRNHLIKLGHHFKTNGDTEVLLKLFIEEGEKMVSRLNGIFAFAIYNKKNASLFLARDRIGVKPLYYYRSTQGEFIFSSYLQPFIQNPEIDKTINFEALGHYLRFGYVIHPHTWLKHVNQLLPGHYMVIGPDDFTIKKYYEWEYNPDVQFNDFDTAYQALNHTLGNSVKNQLISDVTIGTFLSGGVDSTSITGLAQEAYFASNNKPINSYTVRFDEASYDESERSTLIAADLDTNHREIHRDKLIFNSDTLKRIVYGLGEPFADTSALAVCQLTRSINKELKVCLSGDGGDELFYGYSGLRKQLLVQKFKSLPFKDFFLFLTKSGPGTYFRKANKLLALSKLKNQALIVNWLQRWTNDELESLLDAETKKTLFPYSDQSLDLLDNYIGSDKKTSFLQQQINFHIKVNLPCSHLVKVDRMSMLNSVEVRVPMLSNDMLQYCEKLPLEFHLKSKRTKEPLRTIADNLSPAHQTPFRKKGFGFPFVNWIEKDLKHTWEEMNITASLKELGINDKKIQSLLNQHGNDRLNLYQKNRNSQHLYDLLILGVWLRSI